MGHVPKLLTFEQAAKELNVPVTALRTVADQHGKTVRIGRVLRLEETDLKELVRLCRVKPKVPVSSGETDPPKESSLSGKSETQESSQSLPARQIGRQLKRSSLNT